MDRSDPRHRPVEHVTPYLSSREAAETLIAAVEREGDPWQVVRGAELVGRELGAASSWPLVLPSGELLGVVTREAGRPAGSDELIRVLLRTFATLVVVEQGATEVTQRAMEAEQAARSDGLTGLLNRRAWDDALAAENARMERHRHPAVIVVVDVDLLKEVNDGDGHLAGDLLLRRAAGTLRAAVREEDVVARIGGDEFAVLAVEADEQYRSTVLERLRAALVDADVEASVGAAAVAPGASLDEAFQEADRQMYAAKRLRRERKDRREPPAIPTEAAG